MKNTRAYKDTKRTIISRFAVLFEFHVVKKKKKNRVYTVKWLKQ